MITEQQEAEVVYKILQGKASTNADRTASEEPLPSALILTPQNFWFDAESIPLTAPVLADKAIWELTTANGVVKPILQYFAAQTLSPVIGSANAFYSANLRDSIPYNQDPEGSYLYSLKDSTGRALAFGLNNWVVDNQAGVLTFYDGVPAGIQLPLIISFYKYIGQKSFQGLIRSDGSVQMDPAYIPTLPQDVLTKNVFDAGVNIIDGVLNRLKPTAPPNLSAEYLTISNIYTAFQASTGVVHADCTNNTQPSITPNGPFSDGDAGTLTAYLDGHNVGSCQLSTADDSGTYEDLVIISDVDPYAGQSGKANFYKELYASIMPTHALNIAPYAAQLVHSVTGATPVTNFHVDDPQAPTVTNIILFPPPPVGSPSYISGVPTLIVSDQVEVSLNVNNAVRSHYGAIGAVLTSSHVQGASFPITTHPASGSMLTFTGPLQVLPNVYTEAATVSIVGLNSMQTSGPAAVKSSGIRIDTISNEVRVKSGIGLYPVVFGGPFVSSTSISEITSNEELQLLGGLFQWPTGNYTSNRPVAGPNYTSVPTPATVYRWATFQPISLSNANGFILTINGAQNWISNDSFATAGVRIFAKVMQNGNAVTGWIDCNNPYPGVGKPGLISLLNGILTAKNGDPAMVAGDIHTSATSKRITFGPTVYSGLLYVRIGLTPAGGQKFASISVQPN